MEERQLKCNFTNFLKNFVKFTFLNRISYFFSIYRVRISVIILDENDNKPVFQALPYKASIREDLAIGSILFQELEVTDKDLVGDVLEVQCVHRPGFEEGICDGFEIRPRRLETDHDMFRGSVVLKKPLDYR